MTVAGGLVIEPLGKRHERAAFSCGIPELDRYLARQAGQDVRRRIARVFVCRRGGADSAIGYYTLRALSIELMPLPDRLSRTLPRLAKQSHEIVSSPRGSKARKARALNQSQCFAVGAPAPAPADCLRIPPRDGRPCPRLAVPLGGPAADFHRQVIQPPPRVLE